MPSNADLIKQAEELAVELNVEIVTEELSNQQLADLVSDLKAKKKTAAQDGAEEKARAQQEKAAAALEKPKYYVAPRHAITSEKGILSGDSEDEVKAEYLPGGKAALEAFIKSGHIRKG